MVLIIKQYCNYVNIKIIFFCILFKFYLNTIINIYVKYQKDKYLFTKVIYLNFYKL